MWDDFWFVGSVVATFAMGILGAVVTGHDDWGKKHRWRIYAAFCVLGSIGAIAQVRQYQETKAAEKDAQVASLKLAGAISDLGKTATEEARLTKEVREAQSGFGEAQDEVKRLQRANQELATETLKQVIGDPANPPYLYFADFDFSSSPPQARAYLINTSRRYAARVVSLTIQLDNQTYSSESQDISPSSKELRSRVSVTFPSSGMLDSRMIKVSALGADGNVQQVEVILATAAGIYKQRTIAYRVSEKRVVQSWWIYNASDMSKPLLAQRDKDFPSALNALRFSPAKSGEVDDEGTQAKEVQSAPL